MPEAQLPLEINSLEPTWRKQQGCVLHRTHITSVLITHTHTLRIRIRTSSHNKR